MERLTARNKRFPKEAYYPYCFQNDTCDGQGPSDKCDKCPLPYHICETLADYEDTGLTPEQIRELKERDKSKPPIYQVQGDERYEQEPEWWMCPSCKEVYDIDDDYDFCPNCGQRLLR